MNERPPDMPGVARDDELLDLLGSGVLPETTDPTIRSLYVWRTDICQDLETLDTPDATPDPAAELNGRVRPASSSKEPAVGRRRQAGRRRATVAAAMVGLSAGLSGVAVAAADAQPGSPLWPITKIIYVDTAADRQAEADAEAALERARQALAAGRTAEAQRYLDEADRKAGTVGSGRAEALRDALDQMRSAIEQKQSSRATPEPSPTPEPDGSTGGGGTPTSEPESPDPSPSTSLRNDKNKGEPGGGGKDRQSGVEDPDTTSPDTTSPDTTSSGELSSTL